MYKHRVDMISGHNDEQIIPHVKLERFGQSGDLMKVEM
jgi:hypothetical protein